MDGFGIGATMMDWHSFDDADFEEFSAEYFRINQELMAAGLDIHMLSPMDRARVSAALWSDNDLFEEAGAMISMFRQSYGMLDAMYSEHDEHAHKVGAVDEHLKEAEKALKELRESWKTRPKEQRDFVQHDWNTRSKNITGYFFESDDLRLNGASQIVQDNALIHFMEMTPQGQLPNAQYHLGRMHLIEQSHHERLVTGELKDSLAGIMAGFGGSMQAIDLVQETSALDKEPGFWVKRVEAERAEAKSTQQETQGTNPIDVDNWVDHIEEQARRAALLEEEVQAN
ncbi:MAG: hypothetical protein P8P30_05885 [Rickettsiales bacterium]|nr:hypothetical protein [Rickettsiales bacterium]